jgi:hypothetical protein
VNLAVPRRLAWTRGKGGEEGGGSGLGSGVGGLPCGGKERGLATSCGRHHGRRARAGGASVPGLGKRVLTRGPPRHSVGLQQGFKIFQTDSTDFK